MDNLHITDHDLLLDADGELNVAHASAVRNHLAHCWSCRSRKAEIESTISEFVKAHYAKLDETLPPIAGPKALLVARMAHAESLYATTQVRPWMYLGIAAAMMVFAFLVTMRQPAEGPTPNVSLTPGNVLEINQQVVCASGYAEEPPQVSSAVAEAVFLKYGIRNPRPRTYEVDYLIPPSLGGSDDPRNLWPQPYEAGAWNARIKDALEDRLRMLVCERKLDLATAQADLSHNWIAAYKKYFKTETPLVQHAAFVKDHPWE